MNFQDELDKALAELQAQEVLTKMQKDYPTYFERV